MKQYRIKRLVDGSKVGLSGKVVAVPDHDYDKNIDYDDGDPFTVIFKDKVMVYKNFSEAKTFRTFKDRLNRGSYRLGYFEVKGGNLFDKLKEGENI